MWVYTGSVEILVLGVARERESGCEGEECAMSQVIVLGRDMECGMSPYTCDDYGGVHMG